MINRDKAPESGLFVCEYYSKNFKSNCSFQYGRQFFNHKEGTLLCTAPEPITRMHKVEKQYNIANKARIAAIEKTANECFDSKEDREKFISMALDGKQSIPTLKPISPDLIKNTINNLKK